MARRLPTDLNKENLLEVFELAIEDYKEGVFTFDDAENLLLISYGVDLLKPELKTVLSKANIKRFIAKIAGEFRNSEALFRNFLREKDENGHVKEIFYYKSISFEEEDATGKVGFSQ